VAPARSAARAGPPSVLTLSGSFFPKRLRLFLVSENDLGDTCCS
jgi:hypothetical protein